MKATYISNSIREAWRTAAGAIILALATAGCAEEIPGQSGNEGNRSGVNITLDDVGSLPGTMSADSTTIAGWKDGEGGTITLYGSDANAGGTKTRVATTYDAATNAVKSTWVAGDAIHLGISFGDNNNNAYSIVYTYVSKADGEAPVYDNVKGYIYPDGVTTTEDADAIVVLRQLKAAAQAGGNVAVIIQTALTSATDEGSTTVVGTEAFTSTGITLNGTALTEAGNMYYTSMSALQPYAGTDATSPMTLNFAIKGWKRTTALVVLTGGKGYNVNFLAPGANNESYIVLKTGTMGDDTCYVHITPGNYLVQRTDADDNTAYINPGGEAKYDEFKANTYYVYTVALPTGSGAVPGQDYTYSAATKTFTVFSGEGLAAAANAINNGNLTASRSTTNPYANANITLGCDISMKGIGYNPIGTEANPYGGTFDGNGYTIIGISVGDGTGSNIGLIGWLGGGGTIKGVTIDGGTFNGTSYVGALVGNNAGGTVSGNTVKNSSISGVDGQTGLFVGGGTQPAGNTDGGGNYVNGEPLDGYTVSGNNYTILNAKGLKNIAAAINNGTIANNGEGIIINLADDIDMNGETYTPIGTFRGTFNGGGLTIRNLTVNVSGQYAGLIGILESNGIVQAVTIENANITANNTNGSACSGGIVGENHGAVEGCTVDGANISATCASDTGSPYSASSGGIVGDNYGTVIGNSVKDITTSAKDGNGIHQSTGDIYGYNEGGTVTSNTVDGEEIASGNGG